MLREMVKWDYEMKRGDQAADGGGPGHGDCRASPQGPVYLSLPREVLGEALAAAESNSEPSGDPARPGTPAARYRTLADWIADGEEPADHHRAAGRNPRDFVALSRLAERYALPVIPYQTRYFALSAEHPMFQGSVPGRLLAEADLVIVFDTDVPWIPVEGIAAGGCPRCANWRGPVARPPADAKLSVRSDDHRDLPVGPGSAGSGDGENASTPHVAERDRHCGSDPGDCTRRGGRKQSVPGQATTITLPWLNPLPAGGDRRRHESDQRIFVPAGVLPAAHARQSVRAQHGRRSWLGFPRLARCQAGSPGSLVVSVLGDGAYMFANPTACHYARRCRTCRC